MSSHHIVREKQEPALLVLGLDNFSDELLGQLLEWSPTVITTPQTAEKLNMNGIKIDWIISGEANDDLQADVKIMPAAGDSIIEDALEFLVANSFPAVNVVTDEFNLADVIPFADKLDIVVFYNTQKIYPVRSGFSKWKPADQYIELLIHPGQLNTNGLKAVSPDKYQTQADGFFDLQFDEPFLFIAEEV